MSYAVAGLLMRTLHAVAASASRSCTVENVERGQGGGSDDDRDSRCEGVMMTSCMRLDCNVLFNRTRRSEFRILPPLCPLHKTMLRD
ncbi:hypothetical protein EDD16DRAFT_1614975 [Pisolithus croceorrhizus]|nr:hypothetical protein EDD16DRAFT_1614975 [Pisolithus croceorrhizus]